MRTALFIGEVTFPALVHHGCVIDHRFDNHDDATLVALARMGQREALEPLLLRHYASVLGLCQRLLGATPDAQDVAQEAMLQAVLHLTELADASRFGAWLHAIAANGSRMRLRERVTSLDALAPGTRSTVLWSREAPTPEEVYASRVIHDAIIAALGELSGVNRDAVIGFYIQGYRYEELATLLNVPVSTIKGRLFKGRQQLRRTLARVLIDVPRDTISMKGEQMTQENGLVSVTVDSIRVHLVNGTQVMLLREDASGRLMPIWIGPAEADAIALALQGHQSARPMTHDLALQLLEAQGAQLAQVVISRVVEQTFYATITLHRSKRQFTVDARPSDSVALAVRRGVPIFVERTLFQAASMTPEAMNSLSEEEVAELELSNVMEPTTRRTDPQSLLRATLAQVSAALMGRLNDAGVPAGQAITRALVRSAELVTHPIAWEDGERIAAALPGTEGAAQLVVTPELWGQLQSPPAAPPPVPAASPPAAGGASEVPEP